MAYPTYEHHVGTFVGDHAVLAYLRALKWDDRRDGTGDPHPGTRYLRLGDVRTYRLWDGKQWLYFGDAPVDDVTGVLPRRRGRGETLPGANEGYDGGDLFLLTDLANVGPRKFINTESDADPNWVLLRRLVKPDRIPDGVLKGVNGDVAVLPDGAIYTCTTPTNPGTEWDAWDADAGDITPGEVIAGVATLAAPLTYVDVTLPAGDYAATATAEDDNINIFISFSEAGLRLHASAAPRDGETMPIHWQAARLAGD